MTEQQQAHQQEKNQLCGSKSEHVLSTPSDNDSSDVPSSVRSDNDHIR
ncbi:hypothetical protein KOR42_02160 [Thalassoglobus neptunius]|uniref:Uncharacterized protein n=1 Tax=Thalassoglobus neptunius TaxID=1938619 RepID=A0A5C5X3I5_9PLAN|nr:hypothetical protein KOR42_02160 [Thalassoglobus neptunius]